MWFCKNELEKIDKCSLTSDCRGCLDCKEGYETICCKGFIISYYGNPYYPTFFDGM